MACMMLDNIEVKDNLLNDERYKYLFTVERVNALVNSGVPFRDAYLQVGNEVEAGSFQFSGTLNHTHEGSIGNLYNEQIRNSMSEILNNFGKM